MSPDTGRRHPSGAAPMFASGETPTNGEIVAHGDCEAQGARHAGTVAYNALGDGRIAHRPTGAAPHDGIESKQSDVHTQGRSVELHATPEPGTPVEVEVEVLPLAPEEGMSPDSVISSEQLVTQVDRAALAPSGSGDALRASDESALARLQQLEQALALVDTVGDAKGLREMAAAFEIFAKKAVLSREIVLRAAETRLLAEQAVGKKLKTMEKAEGGRPAKNPSSYTIGLQTLRDLGIKPDQSSKWQKIADLPRETLTGYFEEARLSGRPVTTLGAVRRAAAHEQRATGCESQKEVQRRVPRSKAAAISGTCHTACEEVEDRARSQVAPASPRDRDGAHAEEGRQDVLGAGCASKPIASGDAAGDGAGPTANATGEGLVAKREVRGPLSTAVPEPDRAAPELLQDLLALGKRALKLNRADLKGFAAGVLGLAAALAERIEAMGETDSAPRREPHAGQGSALPPKDLAGSAIVDGAGRRREVGK
jgi:hypothetical protein